MDNMELFAVTLESGSPSEQVVLEHEGQDPLSALPEATRTGIESVASDAGCTVTSAQALAGRMRLEFACSLDDTAAQDVASALAEVPEIEKAEPELIATIS